VDLRGALKNTDPVAAGALSASTATEAASKAPSVLTSDIGSIGDQQLSEAVDVLRGLAVISDRAVQ
jgi:hypothetical protein